METRWDLSLIYDSFESKALHDDFNKVKELISTTYEKYKTYLYSPAEDSEKIEYHINIINQINSLILKLTSYARLRNSIDEDKHEAESFENDLQKIMSSLNKINIPFLRYLINVKQLEDVLEETDILKEHRFIILDLKEQAKHLLSDEMEELLGEMQMTGSYAFEKLNNELTHQLLVDVKLDSGTKSMPLSVARNMAYAQSQELRKAAYTAELKSYRKIASASAACLNGIKGEAITIAKARGFSSPLDMTLTDSRMDKDTLDAMFGAIIDARPHFRRYLKKKASLLGHDGSLPYYDLYAPMGHFDFHFTYKEARDFIVETFSEFSSNLGNFAIKAFDNGWIDMEPRDGKSRGSYCCNIHALKESRIAINFTGTFYDITTLAHELGHGFHYECLNNQTILNTDYTMPMAEAASMFCQTLATEKLLQNTTKENYFAILENDLMNFTQMLIEILARYTFETNLFERRKEGNIHVKELNQLLLNAQNFAYGDGLSEEKHPYMWICKPHYYFPDFHFYNFPYPFALLFSKGLTSMYREKKEDFTPLFEKMLTATGSNNVRGIFKILGVDSSDKQFYENAIKEIINEIDEFCSL